MTRFPAYVIGVSLLFIDAKVTAARSESQSSGVAVIDGVTANFRVINPTIQPQAPLKVKLTLRNTSTKPVTFGLIGPLTPNLELYDSAKRKLFFRVGSSLGEYPGFDVQIQPGKEFNTTLTGTLGDYYDLPPGNYYLRFIYDLRLIKNVRARQQLMAKYRSQNVILWDRRWYRITVTR